jgi:hypothetical protein
MFNFLIQGTRVIEETNPDNLLIGIVIKNQSENMYHGKRWNVF